MIESGLRGRWCVLLALFLQRRGRRHCLVQNAIINVQAGLVYRLDVAFAWRQWRYDALGTSQSDRALEAARVERHGALERGGQVMGTRRDGLFAWTALGCAGRVEEAVVL